MECKYVFDSNIFINLQRRQPIDVYPSVWAKVSDLMENGTIISSREVYDEIVAGNDVLADWAKDRKEYFLDSDVEIQQTVRDILKDYRGLVEGGKKSKSNSADPFVIALAQLKHCTVVTEEVLTRNEAAPHIPDVCNGLEIEYTDFVGFSRNMQLAF